MLIRIIILIIILKTIILTSVFSQNKLPFKTGEHVEYKVSFGLLEVGSADLKVLDYVFIDGKNTYHIIGKGRTAYFFDWFFKVRDVYETFIDTSLLLPVRFNRDVYEGGHIIKQSYKFSHKKEKVYTDNTVYDIKNKNHDMLSAFFYARTFKKDLLKNSHTLIIPIFMDEKEYMLEIKYLGNEILQTKFGKIECMVFIPKMQKGRIFADEEEMKIWISDDLNRFLIKVETKIWAGTIKAVLTKYEGNKFPLTIITE